MFYVKAEEITLTIGQAFDLAYRKFLESGGKDVETRKQIAGLQKRVSCKLLFKVIKECAVVSVLPAFYDSIICSVILRMLRIATDALKKNLNKKMKKVLITVRRYFMFTILQGH